MACSHSLSHRRCSIAVNGFVCPWRLCSRLQENPQARTVPAGRTNWTKSILNRLQEGGIDGGLKIFLDRVSGPDCWENRPDAHPHIRETMRGLGSRARSHRTHQQGVSPRSSLSEPARAGEPSPPAGRIRSAWYRSHRILRLSPFPARRLVHVRTKR
jgi:hypothetical protein